MRGKRLPINDRIKQTKKDMELKCACCKRPFRPNVGCYNIPDVGATCIECADKAMKYFCCKDDESYKRARAVKAFIDMVASSSKIEASVEYVKKPGRYNFLLSVKQDNFKDETFFSTLDEIKVIRDVLDKFINECKI